MIRKISLVAALALLAQPVLAQDAATTMEADPEASYAAARNQLGILKYCQTQGFTDGQAVEVQERVLGLIQPGDAAAGDEAEAKGAEGVVSAMGTEVSLADSAAQQGTTPEAQCQQIAALVTQMADQLPAE